MRFTTILATLATVTGTLALPSPSTPANSTSTDGAVMAWDEPGNHNEPDHHWPRSMIAAWWCLKREGLWYPRLHGDWSRERENVHTAWGLPVSCCRSFSEDYARDVAQDETDDMHMTFQKTVKTPDDEPGACDRVITSALDDDTWDYVNIFWRDFGVVPGQWNGDA